MLDRFFARLDALVEEHGLFKVETIGDAARTRSPGTALWASAPPHEQGAVRSRRCVCLASLRSSQPGASRLRPSPQFIVAGGIPDFQEDHTLRIARFALGAVTAASQTLVDTEDPLLGSIRIRAGIHTGSVVGTLVGNLRRRAPTLPVVWVPAVVCRCVSECVLYALRSNTTRPLLRKYTLIGGVVFPSPFPAMYSLARSPSGCAHGPRAGPSQTR